MVTVLKIGICTSVENVAQCIDAGADFVEVNNSKIAGMSESEFNTILDLSHKFPQKILAANCLIPKNIRLTGDVVDYLAVTEFCELSFARLAKLGVKILVFGSSSAKFVPEGFPYDVAMDQLVKCVRIFGNVAAKYGQTVVLEPLRYAECNITNLVRESKELADLSQCENVKAHVDFFHLMQNGETLTELKKYACDLGHVHIASPIMRSLPTFDDGADYKSFIKIIKDANPDMTVSYEGSNDYTPDSLKTMIAFLKSL